jgi:hypothetical protein
MSQNPSTDCVCGEFEEPTNPDMGQRESYRLKVSCEAPTLPTISAITYDPDEDPKFDS